jgi:hypothetical protein
MQGTQNDQKDLGQSRKAKLDGATFPNFKTCNKVILTKTVGSWHKDKHTHQWSRVKSSEISLPFTGAK